MYGLPVHQGRRKEARERKTHKDDFLTDIIWIHHKQTNLILFCHTQPKQQPQPDFAHNSNFIVTSFFPKKDASQSIIIISKLKVMLPCTTIEGKTVNSFFGVNSQFW